MYKRIISSFILLIMLNTVFAGCSTQKAIGNSSVKASLNLQASNNRNLSNVVAKVGTNVNATKKISTPELALAEISKIQQKNYYLKNLTTASTVYYIKSDGLSNEEKQTVMSIQGIVAQTKSEIFMYYKDIDPWFVALQKYYGIKMVEVKSVWELVNKFKSHLKDKGFVRYHYYNPKDTEYNLDHPEAFGSANVATMISGVKKYLMVDDKLIKEAKKIGLVQKADALYYFSQLDAFYALKDSLIQNMMTSVEVNQPTLRDLTIALKMACWRDKDLAELSEITSLLDKNGLIIGWHTEEGQGVNTGSSTGWATIASDWGTNFTIFAGLKKSQLIQKPSANYENIINKNVHYVTFMMSDGDNIQYIEGSYLKNPKYFGSPLRGTIPFGWTLSPALSEFSQLFPLVLYNEATVNDEFVASVSGMGYMYPSIFAPDQLQEFLNRTNVFMKNMNQSYVQIVDWLQDSVTKEDTKRIRDAYAKQSNIKGAFVYPVDNYYLYKKEAGSITWSNSKPFVATRESLWIDEGTVTNEGKIDMISKMAYRINHYKKDPSKIEGYTVVNVHPWSFSYEDVVNMVSLLDDNVVVVTPSEFMSLINKNIPKTDKLMLDDVNNFDYSKMKVFKYQSIAINDIVPTTQTKFTFASNSEGWTLMPGGKALDQIRLAEYSDKGTIKMGVQMAGSHFGIVSDDVNAYMYNKISIPDGATKLAIKYIAIDAKVRLKEIKDDGSEAIIAGYADFNKGDAEHEFDISSLAGKTVTISIEFSDKNTNGTSIIIKEIELR